MVFVYLMIIGLFDMCMWIVFLFGLFIFVLVWLW